VKQNASYILTACGNASLLANRVTIVFSVIQIQGNWIT